MRTEKTMTTHTTVSPGEGEHKARSFARHLPAVARILMGLMFVVFGLNGFLHFIPQPTTPMPEGSVAFAGALMKTGYMFPLVMGTQFVVGVLLLSNCFVPLALALISPVIVGIVTFHAFLAPSGIAMAAVVLVLEVYLAWVYRDAFRPMLAMRTTPGARRSTG
jgi:uncharacterized membrane protein YphA (DoxX/SURF4 family)